MQLSQSIALKEMLREVLETKSSLQVAKRIYLNELKIGVYVPVGDMLRQKNDSLQRKKKAKWNYDEYELLRPNEKLERMNKYTKSLQTRKEKARTKSQVVKTSNCPFSTFDPRANRLATLFSVYAEQSVDSYRRAAKARSFLPPLTQTLRALNKSRWKEARLRQFTDGTSEMRENEKTSLPKLDCDSNTLTTVKD